MEYIEIYLIQLKTMTSIIQKKRNDLQIGDIVKLSDCNCKIIEEKLRSNGGIGYGDNWYVNVCKEINEKYSIKDNGKEIDILIGFSEMGNDFFDIIKPT